MLGYTGTFEGQPISVQSTGMGVPERGDRRTRSSSSWARRGSSASARAVASEPSMRDGRHGDRHRGVARRHHCAAATPTASPRADARRGAGRDGRATRRRAGADARTSGRSSPARSSTTPTPATSPGGATAATSAIEMEAAVLYTVAAVRGVEALAIMTVSDLVSGETSERISDADLKRGVDAMNASPLRRRVRDPRSSDPRSPPGRTNLAGALDGRAISTQTELLHGRRARRPARPPRRRSCRGCSRRCRGPGRSSTRPSGTCTGSDEMMPFGHVVAAVGQRSPSTPSRPRRCRAPTNGCDRRRHWPPTPPTTTPRASMMAAPRLATVGMKVPSTQS